MYKPIIVKIFGGLGNQMFQYAMGRALALRHSAPLYLDTKWYATQSKGDHPRTFQLAFFPGVILNLKTIYSNPPTVYERIWEKITESLFVSKVITEPHYHYWKEIEAVRPPASLKGYWQSEKYFYCYSDIIRQDFNLPALPKGVVSDMARHISATQHSVSVHIRRGDYISNNEANCHHGVLGAEYYNSALRNIFKSCGKITLFLFSDEPQWVQQNFDCCGHYSILVDLGLTNAPYYDMHLMSLCQHHVIANSSFSWWGAWLASSKGMTFAPQRWFANEAIDTSDVCPHRWVRI